MKHFLITRFKYPDDYPYIAERIEMFNRYTLPSVRKQICKDFVWIIIGRPEIDLTGIKHLFFDDVADYSRKGILSPLQSFLMSITEIDDIIISSRLDNDDVILPDYIANVQLIASQYNDERLLIEMNGYWMDLRVNKWYINTRYSEQVTSPFLSLVEPARNLKTVYFDNHSKMSQHFKLVKSDKRGWVQVIHSCNLLMNRIKVGQLNGPEIGCFTCPNCRSQYPTEAELLDHFRTNRICRDRAAELLRSMDIDYAALKKIERE